MTGIQVEVVKVQGYCQGKLEVGDLFRFSSLEIVPIGHQKSCCTAFLTLITNAGRLKLTNNPIFISCPDPGTGLGGNVIFQISKEE